MILFWKLELKKHRYFQYLHSAAVELGYKVIENEILFESNPMSLNNTGVLIIEKNGINKTIVLNPLGCPDYKSTVGINSPALLLQGQSITVSDS